MLRGRIEWDNGSVDKKEHLSCNKRLFRERNVWDGNIKKRECVGCEKHLFIREETCGIKKKHLLERIFEV